MPQNQHSGARGSRCPRQCPGDSQGTPCIWSHGTRRLLAPRGPPSLPGQGLQQRWCWPGSLALRMRRPRHVRGWTQHCPPAGRPSVPRLRPPQGAPGLSLHACFCLHVGVLAGFSVCRGAQAPLPCPLPGTVPIGLLCWPVYAAGSSVGRVCTARPAGLPWVVRLRAP